MADEQRQRPMMGPNLTDALNGITQDSTVGVVAVLGNGTEGIHQARVSHAGRVAAALARDEGVSAVFVLVKDYPKHKRSALQQMTDLKLDKVHVLKVNMGSVPTAFLLGRNSYDTVEEAAMLRYVAERLCAARGLRVRLAVVTTLPHAARSELLVRGAFCGCEAWARTAVGGAADHVVDARASADALQRCANRGFETGDLTSGWYVQAAPTAPEELEHDRFAEEARLIRRVPEHALHFALWYATRVHLPPVRVNRAQLTDADVAAWTRDTFQGYNAWEVVGLGGAWAAEGPTVSVHRSFAAAAAAAVACGSVVINEAVERGKYVVRGVTDVSSIRFSVFRNGPWRVHTMSWLPSMGWTRVCPDSPQGLTHAAGQTDDLAAVGQPVAGHHPTRESAFEAARRSGHTVVNEALAARPKPFVVRACQPNTPVTLAACKNGPWAVHQAPVEVVVALGCGDAVVQTQRVRHAAFVLAHLGINNFLFTGTPAEVTLGGPGGVVGALQASCGPDVRLVTPPAGDLVETIDHTRQEAEPRSITVITDDRARTTLGNARFAMERVLGELCQHRPGALVRLVVVTSRSHAERARVTFERAAQVCLASRGHPWRIESRPCPNPPAPTRENDPQYLANAAELERRHVAAAQTQNPQGAFGELAVQNWT